MMTTVTLSEPCVSRIYRCEDIVVEPRSHRLEQGGHPVFVEPKAYAVLVVLLEQPGMMIHKNELLDAVWGHRNVTPGVLCRVISQLRHALGDLAQHPRYIATVNCLGYRFIGEVYCQEAPPDTLPLAEFTTTSSTDVRGDRTPDGTPFPRRLDRRYLGERRAHLAPRMR